MTNQKHNPSKHNPSPKVKSTPGPWKIHEQTTGLSGIGIYAANGGYRYVAQLSNQDATANAHLIAAAPELLEALKDLLHTCEPIITDSKLEKAKQAIAKAEGGE